MFLLESLSSGISTSFTKTSKGAHTSVLSWAAWTTAAVATALSPSVTSAEDCRLVGDLAPTDGRWSVLESSDVQECFDVVLPRSGWITTVVDGDRPTRLDLLTIDGAARSVGEAPEALLSAVEPGLYRFRVGAEDPEEPGRLDYRIRTAFVSAAQAQGLQEDEEENDGIEIVIDPFADPCNSLVEDEEENDGIEIVIDPFADPCGSGPPSQSAESLRRELVARLCDGLAADAGDDAAENDAGDTFACAALLGDGTIEGRLETDGDRDVFRVELRDRRTLTVELSGSPARLSLFDDRGLALDRGRDRLARLLPAGTYFVTVEATHRKARPQPYELRTSRR